MINKRNEIRKNNNKDAKIKDLNDEINQAIQNHSTNLWKEKLDKNWNHKQNSHIFWNTLNTLQNKRPKQEPNRTISFNKTDKITAKSKAKAFNKQFVNITKHSSNKTNRKIDKKVKNLPKSPKIEITLRTRNLHISINRHRATRPKNNKARPVLPNGSAPSVLGVVTRH